MYLMNTTIDYFCSQLKFLQAGPECAFVGPCNVSIADVTGVQDNPEEMSFIQKVLFDIAESFAQSIQQAINQGSASSVGAQGAAVGSQPQNNIVPFSRPEQAEFNVAAQLARDSMGR